METISLISKSSCNTSITSDENLENTDKYILAKIKRLQIEENYIRHFLRKSIQNNNNCIIHSNNTFSEKSDYQDFKTNINDSYRSVKNLFEFIKTNTANQDILKSVDVEEIKIAILELEEKIKSLKKYLQSQLLNLKRQEEELNNNINENPAKLYKIKKRTNVHSVSYNEIVPSPVKEIINSSFKCSEVQEFQNFMANSVNRHGGWNEYYHNVFITSWNKHVQVNCKINFETLITNVIESEGYQTFLNDLIIKLPGFKTEEIISHSQWYLKYVCLKERQTLAITKWRENKQLIKKQTRAGKETLNDSHKNIKCDHRLNLENDKPGSSCRINNEIIKASLDQTMSKSESYTDDCKITKMDDKDNNLSRITSDHKRLPAKYLKPTKQWISRCQNGYDTPKNNFNSPEHLSKLQIPKWRLGLQDT